MIPKQLDQIEWADLEALRDSGREESDTIEFKGSFSGGSDYLSFNDAQREKAIKGIAREVIAFLNGRGGDVVIGAEEAGNDRPRIAEFKLIPNVSVVADRLAQSLSAVIEPHQTVVGVRAIRPNAEDQGVIVVRSPQSLRAPHRLTKDRECYVRRGRESVPMPMDEIQDLTLRRAALITERLKVLESQFADLAGTLIGRQTLDAHRIHIRTCFVPASKQQIELTDEVLGAFRGSDPVLCIGERREQLGIAFGSLEYQYRPVLRGMSLEGHNRGGASVDDFLYCSKIIRSDGVLRTDFACRTEIPIQGRTTPHKGFYSAWFADYLANTLTSFVGVQRQCPQLGSGVLRVLIHCDGPMTIVSGQSMWARGLDWPSGTIAIPDFEVDDPATLLATFNQIQEDVASIAGILRPAIYKMTSE